MLKLPCILRIVEDKKKLLIADDDADLLRLYTLVFGQSIYAVDSSSDITTTQKLANENKYDAILLDLMFPQGDNLQTIKMIRSEGSLNEKTPVIVLTNLDVGEKTKKALEYGANECLFKANYSPKDLFAEVSRILSDTEKGTA